MEHNERVAHLLSLGMKQFLSERVQEQKIGAGIASSEEASAARRLALDLNIQTLINEGTETGGVAGYTSSSGGCSDRLNNMLAQKDIFERPPLFNFGFGRPEPIKQPPIHPYPW